MIPKMEYYFPPGPILSQFIAENQDLLRYFFGFLQDYEVCRAVSYFSSFTTLSRENYQTELISQGCQRFSLVKTQNQEYVDSLR